MKKVLLIIIVFVVQMVNAQDVASSLNMNKTKVLNQIYSKSLFYDVFTDIEGNIGSVRYFKIEIPKGSGNWIKGITIQKWDEKNNTVLDKTIQLKLESKSSIEEIFYNTGKFYVLERVKDKKNKEINFYAQIFDEEKFLERKKYCLLA